MSTAEPTDDTPTEPTPAPDLATRQREALNRLRRTTANNPLTRRKEQP